MGVYISGPVGIPFWHSSFDGKIFLSGREKTHNKDIKYFVFNHYNKTFECDWLSPARFEH